MIFYVVRRLLVAIPTLVGVATAVFLLMRIIPGDPAHILAGAEASRLDIETLRHQLGLDRSVWEQYLIFLGQILHGDLGLSARSGQPVLGEITSRLPATLSLALAAMVIAVPLGCGLGIVAAVHRGRLADLITSAVSVLAISMPVYWSGLILVLVFSAELHLLPAAGSQGLGIVLPAVTLSLFSMGFITRQTRSAMLEVLNRDYIRAARAKGAGEVRVLVLHALRTALLPIVTIIGVQFGQLLGGAILTETIFAWPGMGRLLVEAVSYRDFPTVQGAVLVFAVAIVAVNLLTDLAYAYVDPRISL